MCRFQCKLLTAWKRGGTGYARKLSPLGSLLPWGEKVEKVGQGEITILHPHPAPLPSREREVKVLMRKCLPTFRSMLNLELKNLHIALA